MSEYEDLVSAKIKLHSAMLEYMREVRNSPYSIISAGDKCLIRADYIAGVNKETGSILDFQVTLTHFNRK